MQEVAYAGQLIEARKLLHTRAAQALQKAFEATDGAGEAAVLLAHHWHQAQDYAHQAAEWDLQAASWLVQRDVNATVARLRSAIAATDKLDPSDAAVRRLAIAARAGIVRSASLVDIPSADVEQAYAQARSMVVAENNPAGLAELLLSNAIYQLNRGSAVDASKLIDEAVSILEETDDTHTLSRFRIPILNVYFTRGQLQRGLDILSLGNDWQQQPINLENFASRALRAIVLAYMGRLPEAQQELKMVLQVTGASAGFMPLW